MQQHWLLPGSCWVVCRSSTYWNCKQRYKNENKMLWFYCYYCATINFNSLFLHRSCKSHCIWPSSGQTVANRPYRVKTLGYPWFKRLLYEEGFYLLLAGFGLVFYTLLRLVLLDKNAKSDSWLYKKRQGGQMKSFCNLLLLVEIPMTEI